MPTYEYVCEKCGRFEAYHKMSEKLEVCPDCGKPVKRQISPVGFYFKDEPGKGRYQGGPSD